MRLTLKACERHGWTLAQWAALDDTEREIWLAWERRRMNELDDIIAQFQEKHAADSGKEYSAWEPGAAATLLAARVG